jgi:hypothetical protein
MRTKQTKKIAFLLLLGFYTISIFSQNSSVELNWTEKLIVPAQQTINILKNDSDCVYYVSDGMLTGYMGRNSGVNKNHLINAFSLSLSKYNKTTKKIQSLSLKLNKGDKSRVYQGTCLIDNEIHIISSFNNKELKKYFYFDETVNAENLVQNDNLKEFAEVDYSKAKTGLFQGCITYFVKQKNSTCFVIKYQFETKEESIKGIKLYDKALKPIANYELPLEYNSYELSSDFDNDGNLYVLSRFFPEKRDTKNYSKSTVFLTYYSKDHKATQKQEIKYANSFIPGITLNINNNSEAICVGLLAGNEKESPLEMFSCKFAKNLIGDGTYHKKGLDNELINNEPETNKEEKNHTSFSAKIDTKHEVLFDVRNTYFQSDNSYYFVFEKYQEYDKVTTSVYPDTKVDFHTIYGDIYVSYCNSEGEFNWTQKISNNQDLIDLKTVSGGFFADCSKENKLKVIYNQNFTKDSRVALIDFNKMGEKHETILSTDTKDAKTICPIFSKSMLNGEIVLVKFSGLGSILPGLIPNYQIAKVK